jgi:hypothetical protein
MHGTALSTFDLEAFLIFVVRGFNSPQLSQIAAANLLLLTTPREVQQAFRHFYQWQLDIKRVRTYSFVYAVFAGT